MPGRYRMVKKLPLGERNAGAFVELLGDLVLGVTAQVVIYQRLRVAQRVHHRKQAWVGILQEGKKIVLFG